MKAPKSAYIALGSNQGNRIDYIQQATQIIAKKIGQIEAISALYETPSWGFEGHDFINACLKVTTRFSPEAVLCHLLAIEEELGRARHPKSEEYQNRNIDLDLLFYENAIIETDNLSLPHPRIAERLFVLQPLQDIAKELLHPLHKKTINQLLLETSDRSSITKIDKKVCIPKTRIKEMSYLAIEGNIGAGKTSLATMISQDFNAKLVTERFKDNPFLPKFYKNQARYAFPLEMSFLADRYQQLIDDIGQYDLFNDFIVADYDIYKSLIFAGVTLADEEYLLYKRLFHIMYREMTKPNLYVYLYQKTDRLLQNIKKRGRAYEQNIPADYLENINRGYLDFIKTQNHLNVKIIDVTDLDFVARREDYLFILEEINKELHS